MPLRCQPSVGESQPLIIPSLAKEVSDSQKVTLLPGGGFKANEQTAVSAGGGLGWEGKVGGGGGGGWGGEFHQASGQEGC